MRLLILTFLFLNFFSTNAQTPRTVLEGFLRDSVTKEELIGASVKVMRNDTLVSGTITDFNGYYRISLDPGIYDVEFFYTGYTIFSINTVTIMAAQTTRQNASLSMSKTLTTWFCFFGFWPPLLDKSPGNSGSTATNAMLRYTH